MCRTPRGGRLPEVILGSMRALPYFLRAQLILEVPFVPSPMNIVHAMLELANPRPGELLVDLGSGDGSILIEAAKNYGCRCIGYEINPVLVFISRKRVAEEGLQGLVTIIHGDILDADIGEADIITAYLSRKAMSILRRKFEREAKEGARIVSHNYPIPGWRARRIMRVRESDGTLHEIFLYQIRRM